MRYSLIILIFSIVRISTIYAQEKDTIRIFPEQKLDKQFLPYKEEQQLNPLQQDYNLDKYARLSESYQFDIGKNKQKNNSRFSKFSATYSRYIIPTAMISYGVFTRNSESLRAFDQNIHDEVCKHVNRSYSIDNYMQYTPTMAIFAFDLAGIKAKHNFRDRAFVTATSYIIMDAAVDRMKDRIDVWRPDNSNNRSFPSGHTATAFVGAHILFREYKDTSPWIGMSGYAVATATGALRIVNKKHWFSDVVTGAGVGILSAEIGYLLLPVFHKILGVNNPDKGLVIAPSIGNNNYGVGLAYTF